MQRKKRLSIGSSNYKGFIESNSYFVDKTLLIKEIIDSAYQVLLIPRPRRFGKSMNLSMLKYYFDVAEKDSVQLFEPYKIWQTEEFYTSKQGKHPVIHLSLKGGKATTFEKSQQHIFSIITNIYRDFIWLLDKEILVAAEVVDFEKVLFKKADAVTYETALKKLSKYLYQYYGEKTLILIDEYDAPIHKGVCHSYYNQIIEVIESLLDNTFKDNDYLYKGVITGTFRITKEGIFSGLTNSGIFTILSSTFADKFGFTKEEVLELLTYFNLEQDYDKVETWYNGYQFGKTKNIYNPWSITSYIKQREDGFNTFWVNTSSDDLIKSKITEKEADDMRSSIEKLLLGKTIHKYIDENIIFSDFEEEEEIIWSLLTFCGYLSPVGQANSEEDQELRIPNYEIKVLFKRIILEWFSKGKELHSDVN